MLHNARFSCTIRDRHRGLLLVPFLLPVVVEAMAMAVVVVFFTISFLCFVLPPLPLPLQLQTELFAVRFFLFGLGVW